MKKIFIILICAIALVACSNNKESKKEPKETKAQILEEVLSLDKKMKELDGFNMSVVEDVAYLDCSDVGVKEVVKNINPKEYTIIKDGDGYAYKAQQLRSEDNEYTYEYFKNQKRYLEYSLLPGDIKDMGDMDAKDLILNISFKAADTRFFDIEKKVEEGKTVYTFVLSKPDEYNKAFPQDHNNDRCGIVGDYVNQTLTLVVNTEGFIERETIEETIRYQNNDTVLEHSDKTEILFGDYNGGQTINFYFIR